MVVGTMHLKTGLSKSELARVATVLSMVVSEIMDGEWRGGHISIIVESDAGWEPAGPTERS